MLDKPPTQVGIPNHLWDLPTKEFEREVKKYLSPRYPLYRLDSYDRENKKVFMK